MSCLRYPGIAVPAIFLCLSTRHQPIICHTSAASDSMLQEGSFMRMAFLFCIVGAWFNCWSSLFDQMCIGSCYSFDICLLFLVLTSWKKVISPAWANMVWSSAKGHEMIKARKTCYTHPAYLCKRYLG
jgi:hypothetical protein